jgi:hypothetical protein
MNCKRCHKELKNPKSMQQGYGPTCLRKIQAATGLNIGNTNTEKSFVPVFEKIRKGNVGTDAKGEPVDKDTQIWTTAHGRTVIL